MAVMDPHYRASAAQMLVKLFDSQGLSSREPIPKIPVEPSKVSHPKIPLNTDPTCRSNAYQPALDFPSMRYLSTTQPKGLYGSPTNRPDRTGKTPAGNAHITFFDPSKGTPIQKTLSPEKPPTQTSDRHTQARHPSPEDRGQDPTQYYYHGNLVIERKPRQDRYKTQNQRPGHEQVGGNEHQDPYQSSRYDYVPEKHTWRPGGNGHRDERDGRQEPPRHKSQGDRHGRRR